MWGAVIERYCGPTKKLVSTTRIITKWEDLCVPPAFAGIEDNGSNAVARTSWIPARRKGVGYLVISSGH